MRKSENNYAFIDAQNLYLNVKTQGWTLDFGRFRVYLKEKYHVSRAYIFIGYKNENISIYKEFERSGYVCIFRPVIRYEGGVKGNCDAELVLQVMIDYPNYDNAIIVSGDGDFYSLIKYLLFKNKLKVVLIPNRFRYSALLKIKLFKKYLRFVNELKYKLSR